MLIEHCPYETLSLGSGDTQTESFAKLTPALAYGFKDYRM